MDLFFQLDYCLFRFREELAQISREIKRRNTMRTELYQYTHLDPDVIPNSINI